MNLTLYRLVGVDLSEGSISQVLSNEHPFKELQLRSDIPARLFLTISDPRIPEWINYLSGITTESIPVNASETAGAMLLVKPYSNKKILYAATWGTGHFLLGPHHVQFDLGIRCALNLISAERDNTKNWNPARLRSLRGKRIGPNTLITQSQYARHTTFESFPFSVDADQLRSVTGRPTDPTVWGESITGGVSLHVKRPTAPKDISSFCQQVERIFQGDRYKKYFSWVDNVSPVNDNNIIQDVRQKLLERLVSDDFDGIGVAPPNLVFWENVTFQYQYGRTHVPVDDPTVESFRNFLHDQGIFDTLNLDLLQRLKLNVFDGDGKELFSLSALVCLTGQIELRGETYIVDEGSIFVVQKSYLKILNQFVDGMPNFSKTLPTATSSMAEATYNERLANTLNGALLLDKQTVTGKGTTAIEICDVALKTQKLIHIKKGTSSAALSHLFSQATVSAELLHMDAEFRKRVRVKVSTVKKGSGAKHLRHFKWLHDVQFDSTRCEVVMAIMTGKAKRKTSELLPFFSKVNLRMRCDDLRRMGFHYSFAQITP